MAQLQQDLAPLELAPRREPRALAARSELARAHSMARAGELARAWSKPQAGDWAVGAGSDKRPGAPWVRGARP